MARPRKRPALAVKAENVRDENVGEVEKEVQNVGKTEPQSPVPLGLQLSEQEFIRRAQELCKESDEGLELHISALRDSIHYQITMLQQALAAMLAKLPASVRGASVVELQTRHQGLIEEFLSATGAGAGAGGDGDGGDGDGDGDGEAGAKGGEERVEVSETNEGMPAGDIVAEDGGTGGANQEVPLGDADAAPPGEGARQVSVKSEDPVADVAAPGGAQEEAEEEDVKPKKRGRKATAMPPVRMTRGQLAALQGAATPLPQADTPMLAQRGGGTARRARPGEVMVSVGGSPLGLFGEGQFTPMPRQNDMFPPPTCQMSTVRITRRMAKEMEGGVVEGTRRGAAVCAEINAVGRTTRKGKKGPIPDKLKKGGAEVSRGMYDGFADIHVETEGGKVISLGRMDDVSGLAEEFKPTAREHLKRIQMQVDALMATLGES